MPTVLTLLMVNSFFDNVQEVNDVTNPDLKLSTLVPLPPAQPRGLEPAPYRGHDGARRG